MFADYECPACISKFQNWSKIKTEFADTCEFYYRNFPLSFHPHAKHAAEFAEAARCLGKYSEAQSYLWKHWGDTKLWEDQDFCRTFGLNYLIVKKAMESSSNVIIAQDIKDAKLLKVSGTPSFFAYDGSKLWKCSNLDQLRAKIQ
jgi:protein-disulfide isomerase